VIVVYRYYTVITNSSLGNTKATVWVITPNVTITTTQQQRRQGQ